MFSAFHKIFYDSSVIVPKEGWSYERAGRVKGECFCIVIKHCNKMVYMNQGLACIVIKPKSFYYIIKAFVIKDLQGKTGYCNKSLRN